MMEKFRLDNKCSLITGGSRGIGFSIAKALAKAGSDIVLLARNKKRLEQAQDDLAKIGRDVRIYPFDMVEVDGIKEIYSKIIEDAGGIDILINNAGGLRRGPAETLSLKDWNFVINLNLSSVFALSQAFAKERIEKEKKGKIINISSVTSEVTRKHIAAYAASKGGIRQLTKSLAVDWAQYHINVNAIGPGYFKTDLTQPLWQDEMFDNWIKKRTPEGRWGSPDELGYAAVFLASPASDFITGQTLYIDGGFLSTMGSVS